MNAKRIIRLFAIVLTLATVMTCATLLFSFNTSGVTKTGDYLVIPGSEMAGASERWQITTKSTANGVWSFTTTGNDPYVNLSGLANVGDTVLQTYPYMVVRYKTSQFTSMEVFCGHPGTAHRRVSMPAPSTNGQWGCLFYDFSQYSANYRSWFRLEVATASGINMEIAEVVLFKNVADVTNYHLAYVGAGSSTIPTVLTFNDFGYHGATNTGRNEASGDTHGITEVRPDNQEAMFNEGGYFTRLTSGGGGDGWVAFTKTNTAISAGISNFAKVAVRYRAASTYNGRTMQIFFGYNSGNWSEENSVKATITGDDSWQWAFFTKPSGSFDSIRFDYMDGTGYIDIAEMYFYNTDADIYNAQVGLNSYRNGGGATWFHSGMYMLHKSGSYFQSVGTVAGGTYAGYQKSATGASFAVGNQAITTVGRTFYKQVAYHSAHNSSTSTVVSTPTCTTAGKTNLSCSLCGELQSTTTQNATGHTPGAAATCTTAQTCTKCGTVVTAAKGHTEVVDAAVAPTCTTAGKTEGKHCSVCNTVLVAQQTIAAKGHTEVTVPGYAATTTATGLTDGVKCGVCGVILVEQEVIPMIPTFTGSNIALNEKFAINVKYNATENDVITVTSDGEDVEYTIENGVLTIANIDARNIDRDYVVTINGFTSTFSVKAYCDYQAENATDEKLAALAESVLVYNQAANNYFEGAGEAVDVPACDVGTDNPRVVENSTTGGPTFYSVRLRLDDGVNVVVRMRDYTDEAVTVTIGGVASAYTLEDVYNLKAVVIPVNPDQYSDDIVISVGDSKLTYSVNTYIQQKQGSTDAADADLVNLVNALGWYGKAAEAYTAA